MESSRVGGTDHSQASSGCWKQVPPLQSAGRAQKFAVGIAQEAVIIPDGCTPVQASAKDLITCGLDAVLAVAALHVAAAKDGPFSLLGSFPMEVLWKPLLMEELKGRERRRMLRLVLNVLVLV